MTVVQNAAEQGRRLARSRRVAFSVKLPPSPNPNPRRRGSAPTRAVDPDGQCRKIHASGGSVEVGLEARDGLATAYVSDTGIGNRRLRSAARLIDSGAADKARSREQGGTGLGLSIARRIVEMHAVRFMSRASLGRARPSKSPSPSRTDDEGR
jgi:hypothetical protein